MKRELAGYGVLVVEDEFFLASEIEETLAQAGARVIGPVADLAGAFDIVRDVDFDLAVLDINLGGEMVYPLADALTALNVPFLFSTSYSGPEIPIEYRHLPRVEKPYSARALIGGVASLIGASAAAG